MKTKNIEAKNVFLLKNNRIQIRNTKQTKLEGKSKYLFLIYFYFFLV